MPKGKKKVIIKKVAKNVYLKDDQIKYIMKKCGGEGNFSPFLTKIIDLYIALSDSRIIQKLDQETIHQLVKEISEDYIRKNFIKNKVLEYPEIFEQLAKNSRYFIPNVESLLEFFLPLIDHFKFLEYEKMQSEDFENLKKIAKLNNLIEDLQLELAPDTGIITMKGKNSYSLLWYAKLLSIVIANWKSHFKIVKFETSENKLMMRVTYIKAKTKEEAISAIKEQFSNPKLMIYDSEDNMGIWNLFNNNLNIIIDREFQVEYITSVKEATEIKIVPFNDIIDRIKTKDNWENAKLILNLYQKLGFVSNLFFDTNKISFSTNLQDFTFKMLKNTFDYLAIPHKIEKKYASSTLTLV